ncbi:HDOD domain-containing protein [Pelagibius sp.]|uniref:HDOD domain-containing protein n=1 Tax=Pelagibius sp. TaxID=1931238 RepID=UPI00261A8849|nr:HDOD domain-containing protein [Pelagibius sp.]
MKPRVLFVDDESNILQGLRRMLRSMRNEWAMDFAEGGEEALKLLEGESYDVLVTDMKMPGIGGAELLDQVAERYPQMLRFILSGEADTEATFRTVVTSHQFFPKPSNSERIVAVISHCLQRRSELESIDTGALVTGVRCLATSRSTFDALAALLDSESATIDQAVELFADEPALAAKVMQLANSAYFGIGDPVFSPKAAANLLGWDVLRALLVNESFVSPYPSGPCRTTYEQAIAQARSVSELSAWIAEQRGASPHVLEQARLAGLLHNLGRLLLCDQACDDYARVVTLVDEGKSLEEAERSIFAASHAVFGAYLAAAWGMPPAVVEAIRHHRQPGASQQGDDARLPLLAVHSALGIVSACDAGEPANTVAARLDTEFLGQEGCVESIADWTEGWRRLGSAA